MESIARTLAASVKAMVPGRFEVMRASPQTHPHVDWNAYARVRKAAAALGFRHLGDIDPVSVHIDTAMSKRVVLAIYVSKDGTEVVGHYRFAPRWTLKGIISRFLGASHDYFDVGTNFDGGDGVSVETTNAALSAVWRSPDFVIRDAQKAGTPLQTLLQAHRERIRRFRAAHPDLTPTAVSALQDVITVANAMERRKLEWRRGFGWATKDEIAAVTKLQGATLDQVFDAFRRQVGDGSPPAAADSVPAPVPAVPAALQFDRVETGDAAASSAQGATLSCSSCTKTITEYFDVDGRHVCADCTEIAARGNEPARGTGVFIKAFVYGGIAAVVGAGIYYAVIAITEFEIGLVALLIGFMVGAAVRTGTAGRGGRRFQVMALLLTYFAVGLAYTPLAVKGAMQSARSDSTGIDTTTMARADSLGLAPPIPPIRVNDSGRVVRLAGENASPDRIDSMRGTMDSAQASLDSARAARDSADAGPGGAAGILLGLGVVLIGGFLMAFALPIFAVLSTMPSGLISALIIGIGMHQAWKMTAAQVHRISGPYRVGANPPTSG